MKSYLIPALWTLLAGASLAAPLMEEVAAFPDRQVTGVGVSSKGRVFVNFPYWADPHTISVAEIKEGKPIPFPDGKWNAKEGEAAQRFVCVQSVVVDKNDHLWIVDTGSPLQKGVVPGGAKLIEIDLAEDKVLRTIPLGSDVATEKSYLNDIRIDADHGSAYLTESGEGSLVVVDLNKGNARKVLANHPSTQVEPDKILEVDGIKPVDPKTGGTPQFHADGIALDAKGGWLFYHALTADTLYKIPTAALRDASLDESQLAGKVEKVAKTSSPDGMLEDGQGGIYLTAFEKNAISRFDTASGKESVILRDDRLQWPDTLSWGPDGWLYVTTSQIHRTAKFNRGVEKLKGPFAVYRIKTQR